VLCTQPRRLAVVAVANRVAEELHEHVGAGAVGLAIGRHVRIAAETRIVFSTAVGRCRLKRVETRVESAWFQRLKLGYDEPLSNFAFILNLRRYTAGCMVEELRAKGDQALRQYSVVGRCRLKRVDPSVESAWFQRLEARI